MLPDINFSEIRPWKGSKYSGFEELCCQLFSLEPPEPGSSFVRKEGAGGDAGVECLWTLPDSREVALQSKYFLESFGSTQWRQLDESVRTALDRHPSLTQYTVCLPRDLTDQRQESRDSQRDAWNKRVEKWSGWATGKGMEVKFILWGSFELTERLTRDDPRYAGRTLYWFGIQALTSEWFGQKFVQSRADLGKRYAPDVDVELPLSDVFNGLGCSPSLADDLRHLRTRVRQAGQSCYSELSDFGRVSGQAVELSELQQALGELDELLGLAPLHTSQPIPAEEMGLGARAAIDRLHELTRPLYGLGGSKRTALGTEERASLRNARYRERQLERELDAVMAFAESTKVDAANVKALLLAGDAGAGKSHVLAAVAKDRVGRGWPTVLLLGQHIDQGNPWDAFLSALDLSHYSVERFLGALDAAGQAAGVRALVLIDAINEGGGWKVWRDRMAGILATIKPFPHVAVALSCRSTYVRSIFPEAVPEEELVFVTHRGFEGRESEAAAVYFDRYGIARPSSPLWAPEFRNPLFLRTCCEALSRQGKTTFPRGLGGVKSVFALYVDSLDRVLQDRLDLDPYEKIGGKALRRVAGRMAEQRSGAIPREEAKGLLESLALPPGGSYSRSLLHHLVDEGALAYDIRYPADSGEDPVDVVRFTFERFSDHFIAEHLLGEAGQADIATALGPTEPLGALLRGPSSWHLAGVVEALAVQVPEKCGRELIALLDGVSVPFDLDEGFLKSVIWRDPQACTEETRDWLTRVGGRNGGERLWETLLQVAAQPGHPFNADCLHAMLMQMDLPNRDELWSIYLAQHHWEGEYGSPESPSQTLVRWAWGSRGAGADEDTARLAACTLAWFFTTSHRGLRDQATKALVSLLSEHPGLVVPLLERFESVNDPYVAERLHASIYGAVLQGQADHELGSIAEAVYEGVFSSGSPPPHVLLRDYARGTIEFAAHQGCLSDSVDLELVRPPYRSCPWPLEFPTEEEAEKSEYESIRSSVVRMGDFGRYVMGDASAWSVSPLDADRPETHRDRVNAFQERVTNDPEPTLREAFAALEEVAAPLRAVGTDGMNIRVLFRRMEGDGMLEGFPSRKAFEALDRQIDAAQAELLDLLPEPEREAFIRDVAPFLPWGDRHQRWDEPVRFDINDERRWVWRRAHSLGWSAERFEAFERTLLGTRQERRVERIGKKYQWIAWHELQARLSDHLHFLGRHREDTAGSILEGPWEIAARDIDPTLLIRTKGRRSDPTFPSPVWWRPGVVEFRDESPTERVDWLWRNRGIPQPARMLRVQSPDNQEWLVLDGYSTWREKDDDSDPGPRRMASLSIRSFIVASRDVSAVVEGMAEQEVDLGALRSRLDYYAFLGEHPWHPVTGAEGDDWRPGSSQPKPSDPIPVPHLVPTAGYLQEQGRDQSIDDRVNLALPVRALREGMQLRWEGGRGVTFRGPGDRVAYFDPSIREEGPPAVLMARDAMLKFLMERDLTIVWVTYHEKQLLGRGADMTYLGRQVEEGIHYTEGDAIKSKQWRRGDRPAEEGAADT